MFVTQTVAQQEEDEDHFLNDWDFVCFKHHQGWQLFWKKIMKEGQEKAQLKRNTDQHSFYHSVIPYKLATKPSMDLCATSEATQLKHAIFTVFCWMLF